MRALFLLVCFIDLCHTGLAGVTSYTAGCIFIHLRHRAALSQPHCAYNQKFGAPVRSTLLDDFALGQWSEWKHSMWYRVIKGWPIGYIGAWRKNPTPTLFVCADVKVFPDVWTNSIWLSSFKKPPSSEKLYSNLSEKPSKSIFSVYKKKCKHFALKVSTKALNHGKITKHFCCICV